jgi:HPt (histidine-containing phosphotransfer) domain-containing protein
MYQPEHGGQAADLAAILLAVGVLQLDRLEATTFGDRAFERDLIDTFLTAYGPQVEQLVAWFSTDHKKLGSALHQLAGASGALGAVRLGSLAAGIERALKTELQPTLMVRLLHELRDEYAEVAAALELRRAPAPPSARRASVR